MPGQANIYYTTTVVDASIGDTNLTEIGRITNVAIDANYNRVHLSADVNIVPDSGVGTVTFGLYRGGVDGTLLGDPWTITLQTGGYQIVTIEAVDLPPAGVYDYTLGITVSGAGATPTLVGPLVMTATVGG